MKVELYSFGSSMVLTKNQNCKVWEEATQGIARAREEASYRTTRIREEAPRGITRAYMPKLKALTLKLRVRSKMRSSQTSHLGMWIGSLFVQSRGFRRNMRKTLRLEMPHLC